MDGCNFCSMRHFRWPAAVLLLATSPSCSEHRESQRELTVTSSAVRQSEIGIVSGSDPVKTIYVKVPIEASCSEKLASSYVAGAISRSLTFGVADLPECPLPAREIPLLVQPYQIVGFWIRVFSAKTPAIGLPSIPVRTEIVSEQGAALNLAAGYATPVLVTKHNGVSNNGELMVLRTGVYRLEMTYQDGARLAVAFSPPIIVLPPG